MEEEYQHPFEEFLDVLCDHWIFLEGRLCQILDIRLAGPRDIVDTFTAYWVYYVRYIDGTLDQVRANVDGFTREVRYATPEDVVKWRLNNAKLKAKGE